MKNFNHTRSPIKLHCYTMYSANAKDLSYGRKVVVYFVVVSNSRIKLRSSVADNAACGKTLVNLRRLM